MRLHLAMTNVPVNMLGLLISFLQRDSASAGFAQHWDRGIKLNPHFILGLSMSRSFISRLSMGKRLHIPGLSSYIRHLGDPSDSSYAGHSNASLQHAPQRRHEPMRSFSFLRTRSRAYIRRNILLVFPAICWYLSQSNMVLF